ncbi:MAG: PAS domain S-box protein [Deltaproteobacteria bacterium]|nr:PAS domain S-box protein [Deltaproteobacteria bacterium]
MIRGIGKSITFKWMAFSILLATIPLIIAGGNIYRVYQKDIKESIIQIQKEKASMVAERTKGFLEKATSNLLFVARDKEITKGSLVHAEGRLKNLVSQNDYLFELAFLNEKGLETIKVSKFKTEETSDQKDQSVSQMFQVASKGQIFYGNFYYTSDGKQAMVIAVPVEKYKGRPVGVLKARLCFEPLTDLLHQTKIGKTGSAYVVDKEGFLIAHPNEKNILLGPFVDQVIAGQEGRLEFENPRKQKYLVVYKPIPELKWGVVVQVPTEEAYGPIKEITRVSILWILIALCAALLLSLFFARRLIQPINRLSHEMAKVSGGDLDVRIETTRKDEIGVLTDSFNRMIQDLKQSQEASKEASERYRNIFENSKEMVYITFANGRFVDINQAGVEMLGYSEKGELFKVNIKDCYLNPEEQKRLQKEVAENGFVKDFEVRFKRKDGTPRDCLITATTRRDRKGHIIGYEGTVKDISDRKRMEEALVQRTRDLEALNEMGALINQTFVNLDTVFPITLEKAMSLTGFEMGAIYLLNEGGDLLEMKYHNGDPPAMAEEAKVLKYGEGVSGKAISLKKPVIASINEYSSFRKAPFLIEEGIKTLVGFPLLAKGKAIGTITLLSRSHHEITPREIHLLENIGNQIGLALENAKLFSDVMEAKSEWETTFDAVTDLISIKDKNYRILRANKPAFERYGMKPEEVIGKRCYEVLYHRESPCEKCAVSDTFLTGRPAIVERESKLFKGIAQFSTFPILDENGEVIAVVESIRDVTEQKRIEKEKETINNINKILTSSLDVREVFRTVHSEFNKVLDSERMTIVIFDEGGEGFRFFALDKDYEIEELKEGVTYPLKGTPSEKALQTGLPVIISNTEESDYWTSQKLLKEGIHSILVFPLEYKEKIFGTLNFGSKAPRHFSEKQLHIIQQVAPGLAFSIQNALLLEEMKQSEKRYRTVVEGAHEGICVIGKDNRFKYVNHRLVEFFGYLEKDFTGMDFRDVVDEESRRLMADRFTGWERGEKLPSRFELNAVRKDGEVRNIEISAKVTKDLQGEINYIVFVKDITEKKKMEEQLLQTEKLRSLGEMASGVAHDFNNALAAILGNTQLLLYTAQDEETREALKTIEKVARDSAQTVKRLQEFTRKRARQELFKLDVNSIVKDAIEITKPKWRNDAQGKGIHIEVLSSLGEVPSVAGNASELREVITNLIFNAVEAMPQGGTIEFHTFKKGGGVHVRIADTGIGMSEEVRKKIFEPFFTTKPFSNTGLGLPMSYGIIKRFRGEIEVESRVGSGTAFTIILPVAPDAKEEAETDATIKMGKSLQILVIDDEETVRSVLARMLSRVNHQVTVANDGEEGIRLFQEKEFDIVLTDLGMPGMSGWEVCGRIKKMNPSTPVGMITGWGMEIDQSRKEEAGLDFIITKPFDFNQIVSVVSEKIEPRT